MLAGEPAALLDTVTVPLDVPAVVGLKLTPKVNVWDAARVTGVPAEVSAKPVPLTAICEICTAEFPVLVTTTLCDEDVPVSTLPKLKLFVLKERPKVAVTPLPVRAMVLGELGSLLTIEILPVAAPAELGENCALKAPLVPGLSEIGIVRAPVLKPEPVAVTCVIVRTEAPLLLIWMVCELVEPVATLPKLTVAGVVVRTGAETGGLEDELATTPAQPENPMLVRPRAKKSATKLCKYQIRGLGVRTSVDIIPSNTPCNKPTKSTQTLATGQWGHLGAASGQSKNLYHRSCPGRRQNLMTNDYTT
jgi:hypothetical protein